MHQTGSWIGRDRYIWMDMDGYEFGSFKVPKWWWLDASMLNLFHQGRWTGFYPLIGVRDRGLNGLGFCKSNQTWQSNSSWTSSINGYTNYLCRSLNYFIHMFFSGRWCNRWSEITVRSSYRSSFPREDLPETRSYYPRAIKHGHGFPPGFPPWFLDDFHGFPH